MFDLWATVPYYTAYLSKALLHEGVNLQVGSITYYLDPRCFSSRGIQLSPGLLDIVGRYPLPKLPRRILKLLEGFLNLSALSVRFLFSPPDIIHVQYLPMLRWPLPLDLWFLRLCHLRGSKILLTVHDILPHDSGQRFLNTFLDLYKQVDGIICHSDTVKARLIAEFHVPPGKIAVIPHGPFFYDLPRNPSALPPELRLPPSAPLVLWQGIIFPYKGIDLLLEAWKHVERAPTDAVLVIAGTGSPDLLDEIRRQIERLGLARVLLLFRFISTEELVALYQSADIVVYPYRAITTSGALATGLSLGKTIVASDLSVFRELLTDRVNALLVDPHNEHQLADAILELLQHPALREQLSNEVTEMNFGDASWNLIAERTLKVYDLLHQKNSVL